MAEVLEKGYAVYPSVKLQRVDSKTGKLVFVKELLFGDYIQPTILKRTGDYSRVVVDGVEYIRVRCRGYSGIIKESDMQPQRILEVNFIDVGQGDGCHIATPDDRHFLIDAGQSENMYRFLKWRFNLKSAYIAPPPFTVVISHPDADHYQGFGSVFSPPEEEELAQKFQIEKVYHNGLVEVKTKAKKPGHPTAQEKLESLGTVIEPEGMDYKKYITDLCDTDEDYQKRVQDEGSAEYVEVLEKTDAPKEALRLGSKPIYDDGKGLKMEIVGPVPECIDGKDALPAFGGDKGKTKNGNSVIILLTMGHLRLLLGGDLNKESENYLIKKYSKVDLDFVKKQLGKKLSDEDRRVFEDDYRKAIDLTSAALGVDIAKSCHHGSSEFTDEFLQVLSPIVTVISSGDEESFSHPRPDTLGAIGKHSRGDRPLIFSTELARSTPEFIELSKLKDSPKKRERVVTVYGMINVRTDGEYVVIAQKLEKPAGKSNWDIHRLKWNGKKGEFEYLMD